MLQPQAIHTFVVQPLIDQKEAAPNSIEASSFLHHTDQCFVTSFANPTPTRVEPLTFATRSKSSTSDIILATAIEPVPHNHLSKKGHQLALIFTMLGIVLGTIPLLVVAICMFWYRRKHNKLQYDSSNEDSAAYTDKPSSTSHSSSRVGVDIERGTDIQDASGVDEKDQQSQTLELGGADKKACQSSVSSVSSKTLAVEERNSD